MSKKYSNIVHAIYEAEFADGSAARISFAQDRKRYERGAVDFAAGRAAVERARNPADIWAPFVFHRVTPRAWSPELCERVAGYYEERSRHVAADHWRMKATRAQLVAGRVYIKVNGEVIATHDDPMTDEAPAAPKAARTSSKTLKALIVELADAIEGRANDVDALLSRARQLAA